MTWRECVASPEFTIVCENCSSILIGAYHCEQGRSSGDRLIVSRTFHGVVHRGIIGSNGRATTLAEQMRPQTLDEVIGQSHFAGRGRVAAADCPARRASQFDFVGSAGDGQDHLSADYCP